MMKRNKQSRRVGVRTLRTLREFGYRSIRELEHDLGILASSRTEVFGCTFGRDSLITILLLLRASGSNPDPYFVSLARKVLASMAELQGKEVNIESGEEPGKCIHEFRPTDHEHLTVHNDQPWYVYPNGEMRNYDTVDATPLFLMMAFEYGRVSGDWDFVETILPNVRAGLQWLEEHGDSNGDGFLDYRFHPDRLSGGLRTQSWMDSAESVFHESGAEAPYPIAPVEVQAYAFVALRSWAHFFTERDPLFAEKLGGQANALKKQFNRHFVLKERSTPVAFAIDGNGNTLVSPRSSMGHCLWAVWRVSAEDEPESILDAEHVSKVVRCLFRRDMFVPGAGFRTLSSLSSRFDPWSYHNGSIWPHDTAIIAGGLENFGEVQRARRVRHALMSAYAHFQTPIELFIHDGKQIGEYCHADGTPAACRIQAWSAASLIVTADALTFR